MRDLEFVTDVTDVTEPGGAGEVVSRPATRTPHPTRTGGQDHGSYTNSLKQEHACFTVSHEAQCGHVQNNLGTLMENNMPFIGREPDSEANWLWTALPLGHSGSY